MPSLQHHILKKFCVGIFAISLKLSNFVISSKPLDKISYFLSKLFFNVVFVRMPSLKKFYRRQLEKLLLIGEK